MDDENKKLLTEKKEGVPPADAYPKADKGEPALTKLDKAQKEYTERSLSRTATTVRDTEGSNKLQVKGWLDSRIMQLEADIADLKEQLQIANLDVEIGMSCMVVEIERPWLHAELFADAELDSGKDTTKLESAVSASSTTANLSVGYSPFALSGSDSSSKSKFRIKMNFTATGCKISVQALQIVSWIQTLLPRLPKPKTGVSTMKGLFA
ncbi:hypothetical protein THARTR1_04546 [Trichoderma harzianum]|uniref:Uncharacterized protein n=1 Tax=Trichoderma harzianum TaxID=5544 RepID=A0A2K0UAP6_TRIHA|nr:hypothetical protein THARTR1_04546 [Trichoderma harzianum]